MDYVWIICQVFVTLVEIGMILIGLGVLIEAMSPGEVKAATKIFDTIARIEIDEDEEEL